MADPRTVAPATSILLTLGLICFAEPGFAQQPDSSASAEALKKLSIEQLMNLEVTSVSRRPERLAQAASAIQVITQQDIRRSGASSLPEALRVVGSGGGGTGLRGCGTARYGGALGSHVN